ncbi:polyketide synthase [Xylaria grammica]|nr:polyketide synthase [Xylaria grammica]
MTEWPENRANVAGFHNSGTMADGMLPARGGHFVNQDPAVFDAPFISMTPGEAAGMDPSQRWALEASYLCFENAGMPLEKLNGLRTAVFGSCMSEDYKTMLFKDPQSLPPGFFNLVGPSIVVDTACSGSIVALDLACQLLHNGDASMALVVGANLLLAPQSTMILGNMGFLSPDGRCFSFDKRANGYARGEGVLPMIVKPLVDAVADNDTIWAKAGLGPYLTCYVEAYDTGIPTGDQIETSALLRAFGDYRSQHELLYL